MPIEDKRLAREVRRELYRNSVIDPSFVTASAINQVVYLGGRVRRLGGPGARHADLKQEMQKVVQAIRKKFPQIREVVSDYRIAG